MSRDSGAWFCPSWVELCSSLHSAPPNVGLPGVKSGFLKKIHTSGAHREWLRVNVCTEGNMASPQSRAALVEDEARKRLTAEKSEFNKSVREMRKLGILPPGVKPKAKHFNMLAAYQNSRAAQSRASSIARDLAAFESVGGVGAQALATLNNPKAKATERAIALQAMIQITKAAPVVMSAGRVEPDEDSPFMIDDSELDSIMEQFGGE